MRTAVVLPAPLGPSRPRTCPGHGQVDPPQGLDAPKDLRSPSALTAS